MPLLLLLGTLTFSILIAHADGFEEEFNAGNTALVTGKTEQARQSFLKAIDLAKPDQKSGIRWFVGATYVKEGRLNKAIEEFKQVTADSKAPNSVKTLARKSLAATYNSLGEPDKAREELLSALQQGVEPPSLKSVLTFDLGMTYFYEKRYPEARQYFVDALAVPDISPSLRPSVDLRIGTSYLAEENYSSATQEYQKILAQPVDEKTSQKQMTLTQAKQLALLELSQVNVGQALQNNQEVLKLKYLTPESESSAQKNIQSLQKIRDDFFAQFDPETRKSVTKTPVKVGALAPDFTMVDANGKTQRLSDYRGKKQVLITFFPKCFTGGCTNHLSTLRDSQAEFDADNTQILAVSIDPADGPQGQLAFARQWGFEFPFIPDTERKLSMLYGAAQTPDDLSSRMSVLVGTDGLVKIVDKRVNVMTHATDLLARMNILNLVDKG